jgi:hypothetical protein
LYGIVADEKGRVQGMNKTGNEGKGTSGFRQGFRESKQNAGLQSASLVLSYTDDMFYPRHVSSWCMSNRKRCFDFALSVIALILFLPLMGLIALLIMTTSEARAFLPGTGGSSPKVVYDPEVQDDEDPSGTVGQRPYCHVPWRPTHDEDWRPAAAAEVGRAASVDQCSAGGYELCRAAAEDRRA